MYVDTFCCGFFKIMPFVCWPSHSFCFTPALARTALVSSSDALVSVNRTHTGGLQNHSKARILQ